MSAPKYPRRKVVKVLWMDVWTNGASLKLDCGHSITASLRMKRAPKTVSCFYCKPITAEAKP